MFRATSLGALVLRIVAVLMIVLGSGGIAISMAVFGQVGSELAKIDATVQSVANTVKVASEGVDATTGALASGITSVVSLLDSTAKGLGTTAATVKDSVKAVEGVSKQVPTLITTTANTIEGAAISVGSTRKDLANVGTQIDSLHKTMDLATTMNKLDEQRTAWTGQSLRLNGQDLVNAAPVLAPIIGVDAGVLKAEGERLISEGAGYLLDLGSIQVTGKELVELSKIAEAIPNLDAAAIRTEGEAALAKGTVWSTVSPNDLKSISSSLGEVDGVMGQVKTALTGTNDEFKVLGDNLSWNAHTIRQSVKDMTGVTDQATLFLDTTSKQLITVNTSLQDVSKTVGGFKGLAEKQLGQVNVGLKETVTAMGAISITALGDQLVGGLRTYMIMTNILFVLAGAGLFAVTLRSSSGMSASEAA